MTTTNNIYGTRILKTLRIGIMNVATLKEKDEELIEVMKMRKLSIMALCETIATSVNNIYGEVHKRREDWSNWGGNSAICR